MIKTFTTKINDKDKERTRVFDAEVGRFMEEHDGKIVGTAQSSVLTSKREVITRLTYTVEYEKAEEKEFNPAL